MNVLKALFLRVVRVVMGIATPTAAAAARLETATELNARCARSRMSRCSDEVPRRVQYRTLATGSPNETIARRLNKATEGYFQRPNATVFLLAAPAPNR